MLEIGIIFPVFLWRAMYHPMFAPYFQAVVVDVVEEFFPSTPQNETERESLFLLDTKQASPKAATGTSSSHQIFFFSFVVFVCIHVHLFRRMGR